jgi:hypothetical protein
VIYLDGSVLSPIAGVRLWRNRWRLVVQLAESVSGVEPSVGLAARAPSRRDAVLDNWSRVATAARAWRAGAALNPRMSLKHAVELLFALLVSHRLDGSFRRPAILRRLATPVDDVQAAVELFESDFACGVKLAESCLVHQHGRRQ